jgi:non-canonical purine NTP pyrophosphatase (RdgB/HAM1 family)
MTDFVFISGNQHKADKLAMYLGVPIDHQKVDLEEIQSLDVRKIVEDKARRAYEIVKKPVLVEDVGLTFTAMGRLPGPLIKWFLEELGNEGLAKLAAGLEHQQAEAFITYGYYDGRDMHFFDAAISGKIASEPRGEFGFGWNAIFIPDGSDKTYAEMTDEELLPFSHRAKAVEKLKAYLQQM